MIWKLETRDVILLRENLGCFCEGEGIYLYRLRIEERTGGPCPLLSRLGSDVLRCPRMRSVPSLAVLMCTERDDGRQL